MSQDPWDMQEEVDRRERIARILQSPELLLWHSMNNQEVKLPLQYARIVKLIRLLQSVPQTRMRLRYQLCGIKEPEPHWEDEFASDARDEEEAKRRRSKASKKATAEKEKERGAKRGSSGAAKT